jgi:hypothetical protein
MRRDGLTVTEVKGLAARKATPSCTAVEYVVDFLPKVKIDVVVATEDVDRCVDAVVAAACTGKIGDGKIFVTPWSVWCASAPVTWTTPPSDGALPGQRVALQACSFQQGPLPSRAPAAIPSRDLQQRDHFPI